MNETPIADALPRTSAYLLCEIEARSLMTAAQVCIVDAQGHTHGFAAGDAAIEVDASTIFRIWCGAKPFTAIAIAQIVEAGLVDLDTPLAEFLPDVRSVAPTSTSRVTTLRSVLNHTAGLHVPTAPQMELVPNADRARLLRARDWVPAEWRVGEDRAYSEVLGWYVLGLLLETVTGSTLREHLRSSVFEPLGMHRTWIGMAEADYWANADSIGVNYDFRHAKPYPVLFERNERLCRDANCSYGGYTTAADLAHFYAQLLAGFRGETGGMLPSSATLRRFCRTDGAASWDQIFERHCAFGLGFMTELSGHHFGSFPSDKAFGHSGWAGSSFGFADPHANVAAAVITNGLLPSAAAHLSRLQIVQCIYEDVGVARAQSTIAG
jgi:CubicO group peptidase (beta-lactamase class C family)